MGQMILKTRRITVPDQSRSSGKQLALIRKAIKGIWAMFNKADQASIIEA
jgi:hypothetical protein